MTSQADAKRRTDQITGVSNIAFDLVATLENKLKGIAAIEAYKEDCSGPNDRDCLALLEEIQQRDKEQVEKLREW